MNSIRRPRNRPRVKSVNFRSFWWLVRRQAALQIIAGPLSNLVSDAFTRWVLHHRPDALRDRVARTLRDKPERRIYP